MEKLCIKKPINLLEALRKIYPDSSTTTLRKLLKHKRVLVDNRVVVRGNHLLKVMQVVSIGASPKPIPHGIQLIYEDEYLIVINKPKGLLSVPLDTGIATNALNILREYFQSNQVYAVHRIDKDTSGLIVFARGKQSIEPLNAMFKNHDFKRVYLAVVMGYLKEDKGTWTSRLVEYNEYQVQTTKNLHEGHEATTHFSVIKRSKNFSFLKLTLETGKKHQIRVHCKEAGHPIVGDKKYGSKFCDPISRMCLHSFLLEFIHPFSKEKMCLTTPVPSQFAKLGLINFSKESLI